MSPIFETDPKLAKNKKTKPAVEPEKPRKKPAAEPIGLLQQTIGNQAVQRLAAHPGGEGGFELEEETVQRIQAERSKGEALDSGVQADLGGKFDQDFSGVRVHTSPEADALSRELGARAFTTGSDIFFRAGAYEPGSSSGQRLIAHELTHVLQQGGEAAQGNANFRVNSPGDVYEKEADSLANQALSANPVGTAADLQRQEEEEELIQMQEEEEEEELVQLQEEEDETYKGSDLDEVMAGEGKAAPEETTVKPSESAETMPGEAKAVPEETTAKEIETDLTIPEEEYRSTEKPEEEEEISKL